MSRRITLIRVAAGLSLAVALVFTVTAARTAPSLSASLVSGKAQLMSAGPLAFGPEGVLFVGDSVGGAVVAMDTDDHTAPRSAVKINVQGVDAKIAALVGVTPDQIVINDVKVNPISKNVYLSASRGTRAGCDAADCPRGRLGQGLRCFRSITSKHSSVSLTDAPACEPHCPAESAHADHHRYELRERQPDGGGPVERRVVFRAALDSVPVQDRGPRRHAPDLAFIARPV